MSQISTISYGREFRGYDKVYWWASSLHTDLLNSLISAYYDSRAVIAWLYQTLPPMGLRASWHIPLRYCMRWRIPDTPTTPFPTPHNFSRDLTYLKKMTPRLSILNQARRNAVILAPNRSYYQYLSALRYPSASPGWCGRALVGRLILVRQSAGEATLSPFSPSRQPHHGHHPHSHWFLDRSKQIVGSFSGLGIDVRLRCLFLVAHTVALMVFRFFLFFFLLIKSFFCLTSAFSFRSAQQRVESQFAGIIETKRLSISL